MPSTVKNIFWKFSEQIASQAISFIISIILARILDPSEYGAVAMVAIFVALAKVIVDGGFNSALIQKKNADIVDYSTVFYFTVFSSIIVYVILFLVAPLISSFYGESYEILTPILRVLGLQIIIFAINSVQQAYVSKKMMFKSFFWATLIGTVVSGIVGLALAFSGFGVWALVAQALTAAIVNTITLFCLIRKLPALVFSINRLKPLLNYGYKLFGASMLVAVFQELRALIIGKLYSPSDLAFFDRGRQYPSLVVNNFSSSIGAVLFPKMSLEQDNMEQVKETTRKSIRFCSYLMCPLMVWLAATSEPLIRLMLTEKWLPCVPLLQLFCVVFLFMPIHNANMQAIKAIGRSDVFFKLEIIKKTIEIVTLVCVMWISVTAIVFNMAILNILFTFINAYPNRKLINYTYKEQFGDLKYPVIMSLFIFIIMTLIGNLGIPDFYLICIQLIIAFLTYTFLSILFKIPEYYYILNNYIYRKNEKQ